MRRELDFIRRWRPIVICAALAACTAAQIQTASADLQAGCALYASVAAPLATAPDPQVKAYLAYGNAMCDVATGRVQTAALPNVDSTTAAWIGSISGALQALQAVKPAVPATKA